MSSPLPPASKTDIFGVCSRIGADLGVHPDILRIAFAVGLFVAPLATVGVYAALGAAVALGRWLFPAPKPVATVPASAAPVVSLPTHVAQDVAEPLRAAA